MPISNSIKVLELPSLAVELIVLTPLIERTADSTSWVIWFSISVGAAPGCEIETLTAGNSISGLLTTSICAKASSPANSSAVNATSGMMGLRIDHAEMFWKFIARQVPLLSANCGLTVSPAVRNPPARRTTRSRPVSPSVITMPDRVTEPVVTARRCALLSASTI